MAKQRRTRKTRTVEDVNQEIAQLQLQIQMMQLDIQKLELEKQFLKNGQVLTEPAAPKAQPKAKAEQK